MTDGRAREIGSPMFEFVGLLMLAAACWLWYDSLKAREVGIHASRRACAAEGLLFLDDTVAIRSIWPVRDDNGHLTLRRVYAFEYSESGDERRGGTVTLIGNQAIVLDLG